MTDEEAVKLLMGIEAIAGDEGWELVKGKGIRGECGTCFLLASPNGSRHLITCENDWYDAEAAYKAELSQ